jgi:hypothetical protein
VYNIGVERSGQLWKLPIIPEIPVERAWFHFGDVSGKPSVGTKSGGLHQLTLPWRDDKMDGGNFRLLQKASHQIEGMALQPGEVEREGGGGDQNLHGFDLS